MKSTVRLSETSPFVRYSRVVTVSEIRKFREEICASDCRLFYCLDGKGGIEIDGEMHSVEAGTLLLFPSGVPYSYRPSNEFPMNLLALNFDYVWTSSDKSTPIPPVKKCDFSPDSILSPVQFTDAAELNSPIVLKKMNSVFPLLSEINCEYEKKEAWYEIRCSCILKNLITRVLVHNTNNGNREGNGELTDELIEFIRLNYKDKINLALLGQRFGYHPNYLNGLFRERTGKTVYSYLQEYRINQAISLLQSTEAPVSEIAVSVGFGDLSHFSKAFKKITGYAPSSFRLN